MSVGIHYDVCCKPKLSKYYRTEHNYFLFSSAGLTIMYPPPKINLKDFLNQYINKILNEVGRFTSDIPKYKHKILT